MSDISLSDAALAERTAVCIDLVRAAGPIALAGFAKARYGGVKMKGPQDFLTETDGAVERHLRDGLAAAFPDDGFLGEEEGGSPSARVWVADPIDGTANFARGIAHFCTSVAFVAHGRTEIGIICNPATDELWVARRGHGATLNGRPAAVATTDAFEVATVEFGWSQRQSNKDYLGCVAAILEAGANVRRSGSGALGLAYVADGRMDAYGELHMNAWDCLAGLLLVEEAGGRVNDFLAGAGLTEGNPVLAAAPAIADRLAGITGIPLAG